MMESVRIRYWNSILYESVTAETDISEITIVTMEPSISDDANDRQDDSRPFAHRAPKPRPARRLNHGFKYLYRHDLPDHLPDDPMQYLMEYGGYSREQVLSMNATFPPLLSMSVERQLHPKMRFLKETLGVVRPHLESTVPAEYFGARLEKILAPRHAWLVHNNLTHGAALFRTPSPNDNATTLWTDFVRAARKPHGMAALCTEWARNSGNTVVTTPNITIVSATATATITTPRQIEAFDALFGRGLLAMARGELVQHNNTWPLEYFHTDTNESSSEISKPRLTAADLTHLLIRHGANPSAVDHRGVSLMHWAAGAGNLPVFRVLQDSCDDDLAHLVTQRDQATLLHWASAGARAREFGCGGHVHICEYLLAQWDVNEDKDKQMRSRRRDYVNALTLDGNSALHWAAWSGTLETVKLLVRYRANVHQANRNGCTVAHWAASGGNVEVCRYLYSICNVDFTEPNHGGNTPLTHAVAFGRAPVIEWLRNEVLEDEDLKSDQAALELAQDFVGWLPTDNRRKEVLQLFQEFLDYDQGSLL